MLNLRNSTGRCLWLAALRLPLGPAVMHALTRLLARTAAALLHDAASWDWQHFAMFWAVHIVLIEVLNQGIIFQLLARLTPRRIRKGGGHLDEFSNLDVAFIIFNRLCTPFLTYGMFRFAWLHPEHVEWDLGNITVLNTAGSFAAFLVVYDCFYTAFHRLLHVRALYPLVHKHHHRQHAPSRGNTDAVNVHPFEFFSGEMLHLVCVVLVPCHAAAVLAFLVWSGITASLNHTRIDLFIPPKLYDVKAHDMHHRIPTVNYGQYIMLWDYLTGSYRSYEEPKQVHAPGQEGGGKTQ
jgi:sterol desaturase/sphingolipid hydroxylase (fatty acid hydroxylase superfamily)